MKTSTRKETFKTHLYETNQSGSGKANSYLRALDLLSEMLKEEPFSFSDCIDIWSVDSPERLLSLRDFVLKEQKRGSASPWVCDEIPVSYLRDGYCSAALTQLVEFFSQYKHSEIISDIFDSHAGSESQMATKLDIDPVIPEGLVDNPKSKEGKDRLAQVKARIGQHAFRKIILKLYKNSCCITGLDIPSVNRASHIIPWSEKKETRMDPRNGLCLSATYDAAFDSNLISLDDDYRIILSKDIKEHYTSDSVKQHFLSKEGTPIKLPASYHPIPQYLEKHRARGNF